MPELFKKKCIAFFIVALFFPVNVKGQELLCNVQVISNQIQGTNKQIFETLQKAIYEFMNNTSWTNNVFEINERIECNLLLNITKQVNAEEFEGTLQIQSRRPVYNATYNTVLLNYIDNDVQFKKQVCYKCFHKKE